MSERAPFRQSDVRRAVQAVRSCGLEVRAVKIGQDGKIEIDIGEPGGTLSPYDSWKQGEGDARAT